MKNRCNYQLLPIIIVMYAISTYYNYENSPNFEIIKTFSDFQLAENIYERLVKEEYKSECKCECKRNVNNVNVKEQTILGNIVLRGTKINDDEGEYFYFLIQLP